VSMLKPCPFCEGRPCIVSYHKQRQIACVSDDCLIKPRTEWAGNLLKAIVAWNRRVEQKVAK
jgi:hypothetical protein